MAQHDLNIANQGFPAFRSDLNNALSAIQTTHSGTSRPTGAVAGQIWLDTTSATTPTLKYYDGTDDISLATIDHTANTVNWLDSTVVADLLNDTTPQLGGNLDVNGNSIVSVSNGNITLAPNGTGVVTITGNLSVNSGTIRLDGNYPVGTNNVAIGDLALDDGSLSGGCNVAVGTSALTANTTASNNTAVGNSALSKTTTGVENTAVGSRTLQENLTGVSNVAVGDRALCLNTSSNNTAIGSLSMIANTSGSNNVAVGQSSLCSNTTGSSHVAIGFCSLAKNTTAGGNTAVGNLSLFSNTTGATNTAVGVETLYSNTTGSDNVAIGRCALCKSTTASNNTAIGIAALFNTTTGGSNTAIGQGALECNIVNTDNVAVGRASLQNNKGDANTMVGSATGNNLTTGCYNTYVGAYHAGSAVGVLFEYIYGYSGTGKGSNTFFVTAVNGSYNGGNTTTWTQTSDRRIKKNITDNNDGLEKIKKIRVRNFEYRKPEEITELPSHSAIIKEGVQLGVISQEVQEILPNMIKQESTGVLSFNSDNLIWYLVNAIKELSTKVEDLQTKINQLES